MSVVLAIEEIGPCRKQLRIEVPAPAVEAEMARITGEYSRRARLPGFRKGKVPPALVQRHYADEIRRELLDRLVPRYWRQATAEKSLDPLGPPTVEKYELDTGAPLTFTAVVEVKPEFELRNYKDFALPEPPTEPTPEEADRAIEDLRRSHGEWIAVERAAGQGDRVAVEVREVGGDSPAEPQSAEVEIGSPSVWEELGLAVTGLSAGQSGHFTRREGEGEEARERSFDVQVQEVKEIRLPELDLELAGHFGKFESVDEFRADVTRRLREAKQDAAREERERALLDQLGERHPMPLPEGVIKAETEDLMRDYAQGLARRGVDLEHAEIDWKSIAEQAKPHAERRIKARLILDAIGEREAISVAEQEFEEALALLARAQGMPSGALRQQLDSSGELAGLRSRMRREKVIRYLLGESPAPEPAAEGAD